MAFTRGCSCMPKSRALLRRHPGENCLSSMVGYWFQIAGCLEVPMKVSIRMALVMAPFIVGTPSRAEFVLVSDGQPRAEIVVVDSQATSPVAFAGLELQR